ncbi:MAG: SMI1/KNR4 family protein [Planctomycetales bacterium]|nr:SMI1/KNR4 family protein [Planctomycetales bacterium]
MGIERLMKIVTPPEPLGVMVSSARWAEAEKEVGSTFPADYREFVNRYGAGAFYNFMEISSPFSPRSNLMAIHNKWSHYFHDQVVFPVYPEAGGILRVGGDENGNLLFWVTRGEPDKWPIVYFTPDFQDHELYVSNITDFLSDWLSGVIEPLCLCNVKDLQRDVPVFTSIT